MMKLLVLLCTIALFASCKKETPKLKSTFATYIYKRLTPQNKKVIVLYTDNYQVPYKLVDSSKDEINSIVQLEIDTITGVYTCSHNFFKVSCKISDSLILQGNSNEGVGAIVVNAEDSEIINEKFYKNAEDYRPLSYTFNIGLDLYINGVHVKDGYYNLKPMSISFFK